MPTDFRNEKSLLLCSLTGPDGVEVSERLPVDPPPRFRRIIGKATHMAIWAVGKRVCWFVPDFDDVVGPGDEVRFSSLYIDVVGSIPDDAPPRGQDMREMGRPDDWRDARIAEITSQHDALVAAVSAHQQEIARLQAKVGERGAEKAALQVALEAKLYPPSGTTCHRSPGRFAEPNAKTGQDDDPWRPKVDDPFITIWSVTSEGGFDIYRATGLGISVGGESIDEVCKSIPVWLRHAKTADLRAKRGQEY